MKHRGYKREFAHCRHILKALRTSWIQATVWLQKTCSRWHRMETADPQHLPSAIRQGKYWAYTTAKAQNDPTSPDSRMMLDRSAMRSCNFPLRVTAASPAIAPTQAKNSLDPDHSEALQHRLLKEKIYFTESFAIYLLPDHRLPVQEDNRSGHNRPGRQSENPQLHSVLWWRTVEPPKKKKKKE